MTPSKIKATPMGFASHEQMLQYWSDREATRSRKLQ
jgi:hypothetical protein